VKRGYGGVEKRGSRKGPQIPHYFGQIYATDADDAGVATGRLSDFFNCIGRTKKPTLLNVTTNTNAITLSFARFNKTSTPYINRSVNELKVAALCHTYRRL